MSFTVRVFGIFTNNSRSSTSAPERRARLRSDIANANRAWNQGFAGGVRCGINFVFGDTYNRTNHTINASNLPTKDVLNRTDVMNLINDVRRREGDATAIYVLYLSGERFSNGRTVGVAGSRPKFNGIGRVGHVVLTNRAGNVNNPYTFAHEAGHCLGLDDITSSNKQCRNLMCNSPIPSINPILRDDQCRAAKRSPVILRSTNMSKQKTRYQRNTRLTPITKKVQNKRRYSNGCKPIRKRTRKILVLEN